MSLAELERDLTGARERLSGMEQQLADYHTNIQSCVTQFGKRQIERSFGT